MCINKRMGFERHRDGMLKRRVPSVVLGLTVLLALVAPPFIPSVQAQTEGAVRLVDPNGGKFKGRVEIFHNGQWGTVCDDFFRGNAARVVCNQLGYAGTPHALLRAPFGEGTGPIWLDDVRCQGDEASLADCRHRDWGIENCEHHEDVGVACNLAPTFDHGSSTRFQMAANTGPNVAVGEPVPATDENLDSLTYSLEGTDAASFTVDAANGQLRTAPGRMLKSGYELTLKVSDTYGGSNTIEVMIALDSSPTRVVLSVSPGSVSEDAGDTSVTATGTLDGAALATDTEVTVSVGATGDTATGGTDYATVHNFTLMIDAGQILGTVTFTLTPANDSLGEGAEKISVTGTTAASGLSVAGTELTITDDDSVSTEVVLSVDPASVSEDAGDTLVTVTGTLDGGARAEATTVTVSVGKAGDTATEGTDYATVNDFTLTIGAGQNPGTATFTLTPTNDPLGDGVETISVTGTAAASGLSVTGTELTITDDDVSSRKVELTVDPTSVAEDAGATTFMVTGTLDGAPEAEGLDVNVSVGKAGDTATEGTDYARVNNFKLRINAGQTSGTATFTLTPTNDRQGEKDEKVALEAWVGFLRFLDVIGTELTIIDDEPLIAEGAARLVGGMNALEGRVEVYVDGLWGTVCDDRFGIEEALVVCRQLGHSGAQEVRGDASFGPGSGPINMNEVVCQGFEKRLTDCNYDGANDCRHVEDAGVVCGATGVDLTVNPTSVAEDAGGTLVTVTGTLSGAVRTEVTTMTVSVGAETDPATEGTDYTTVNDLTLTIGAGQTSGTATFALTPTNDTLGEGDEKISVTGTTAASDLSVTELTITDDEVLSRKVELTVDPTSVAEDAGDTTFMVTGTLDGGARSEATVMNVRVGLDIADVAIEGRDYTTVNGNFTLTIYAGQTSGTATFTLTPTNDLWDEVDENVSVWGFDWQGKLDVIGTELMIVDDDESVAKEGAVRLVGGMNALEGRVEVYVDGLWGTVCDDGFGLEEALVVCRQLGHSGVQEVRWNAYFGEGSDPINMDEVVCRGTEGRLTDCNYDGTDNCGHHEDVGVECRAVSAATGVDLTVNPTSVEENAAGTSVTVTGTLDGAARTEATTVTVLVGAATDPATEGTDYTTVNDLTLTIGTGQTSGTATFTLTPTNDTLGEGDETISVTGTTTVPGLTVTGTELTITDDDSASTEVELSVSLSSVVENAAGTPVTVTGTLDGGARPEATTVTVLVGAATDPATEGTDYTTVNDLTLTIGTGQTSGTATFTLTPTNDTLGEGDETISVTGTTTVPGLTVTGTELTITDDDSVSTEVELTVSLSSVEENAAGTPVTVTGTLDGAARPEATTVTVLVGAATDPANEGTDYTTVNDLTLTIGTGQTSGTATFTLTPTNDTLGEGDETISVTGTTTVPGLTVTGTELTITDDDSVSTEVELTVSLSSVEENAAGTSVTVTGTLDGGARPDATTVTVSVGATADSATEGTDYATVNDLTLMIDAGQPSGTATFTLTPTNDTLGEGDETISVTGTTTVPGLTVTGTELTITDDDSASTEVELTVSLSSVVENAVGTPVTVTGTLDGGARTSDTQVTVTVGASGDGATEGTDYTTVNDLTLTIGTGQTSGTATFTLTPTNDTLGEGDETISVTGTTTVPGLSVTGTELTITDDDSASTEVELTVSLSSVEENAAGTSVTVTGTLDGGARPEATTVTVLVGASTDPANEGTDYTTVNDLTLTIGTGQTSGTATFTLTPTNDTLGEGDETISVTGTTTVPGLTVTGTELTITDDDSASTEVELTVSLSSVEENAAGTSVTVTGTLDGGARPDATTVTVLVGATADSATEGTDYTTVNDLTLTIGTGQTSGTATFTLTPTNDTLGEGDETISVTGTTTVPGLTVTRTELTITDDELVSTEVELSVSLTSVAENAAGTPVTVTGTLDGGARPDATTVTVSVGATADSATEGTDYATVNDLTLTINAGQPSGTATFTLTVTNDTLGEGGEKVSVMGTTTVSGLSVSGTELTITDDEVVSTEVELTVSLRSVAENAAGTPVTVTGTLDGGARTDATTVTVSVGATADSATEGTDYATVNDLTLTIDAGQPSGTATFTLTLTNDTLGEGAETISVTGGTTVSGLSVRGAELTITDDELVSTEVELSVSLTSVAENAAGTSVTVTGTLDGGARPDATTVTVSVGATADSATEGTDYTTVNDLTLTIGTGQPSGTATFTLTPTNDTLGEGGEKVSVMGTTTVPGLSVSGTELTITDDDSVSTEVELTVSLSSVEENAAGTSVTVTGTLDGGARPDATTVTVSVGATADSATEGTDYATVNDLTLTIGTGQTSGTATFTLTPTNDTLGEGGEKVSVMGTTTVSGLSVRGTELTITDDEVVSTEVELTVSLRSVAEDAAGTPVTVTGSLDGGARTSDTQVTVTVGASGDGAAEGTDYAAVNNFTLTIDAGQTSGTATFTLTPTDDLLGEGSEKVSVTGTTTVPGLSVRGTELTITDDEVVSTEVELTVSLRSVAEDAAGTPVTVTGSLDGGARTSDTPVTVTVGASGDGAAEGTDYAAVNNFTLTIDAGQTSGTATFTLTPTNDTLGEGGEKVSVTGTTTVSGLSVRGTELTITDDEVVSTEVELTVSLRSVAEDAAGTPVTVTGSLDGGARTSDTPVTVTVGASGDGAAEGTDYAAVNNFTLTIDAGQTSGTATFTLTPTDDLLGEGSEKVSVTGRTTVSGLSVSGTELTITDDELVSTEVELTVSLRSVAEDAGGTPVTVTGSLNGGARTSDTPVTVTVGASGDGAAEGTDYAAVNDLTLTIDAGQTSGTATFTLTPTDDLLVEGGEKVSVTGSTTVSGLSVSGTELTITDDDSASTEVELTVSLRSVAEDAAGTPVTVTGTLDGGARTDATTVTVSVGATGDSATEGTDYATVNDLTLMIDAGQPSGTATFTLTVTNDTLGEGDETISVTGRTTVPGLSVSGTELTITDDELVSTEVELSVSLRSVAENAAGTPVTVTGTLDGGARTDATTVTMSVGATADSATEGTDYATVNDLTLTIDAGQPSGTATFTLTLTNDTLGEGGEKVSVMGTTTVSGLSVSGTELTITDDEVVSTEVELTVSLRSVAENAAGTPVTVTGTLDGGARTDATTVTVSVGATVDSATEGTDYATVNDLTLTIDAGQPSGTATFTLTLTNTR